MPLGAVDFMSAWEIGVNLSLYMQATATKVTEVTFLHLLPLVARRMPPARTGQVFSNSMTVNGLN